MDAARHLSDGTEIGVGEGSQEMHTWEDFPLLGMTNVEAAKRAGYPTPYALRTHLDTCRFLEALDMLTDLHICENDANSHAVYEALFGIPPAIVVLRPQFETQNLAGPPADVTWESFDASVDDEHARGHGDKIETILNLETPMDLFQYLFPNGFDRSMLDAADKLLDQGVCIDDAHAIALCAAIVEWGKGKNAPNKICKALAQGKSNYRSKNRATSEQTDQDSSGWDDDDIGGGGASGRDTRGPTDPTRIAAASEYTWEEFDALALQKAERDRRPWIMGHATNAPKHGFHFPKDLFAKQATALKLDRLDTWLHRLVTRPPAICENEYPTRWP
eukprot:m.157726 g.157726  ORF g.157726 m.157726 type:complete len:332 (+) comp11731_c1_seq2:4975-5970(+)